MESPGQGHQPTAPTPGRPRHPARPQAAPAALPRRPRRYPSRSPFPGQPRSPALSPRATPDTFAAPTKGQPSPPEPRAPRGDSGGAGARRSPPRLAPPSEGHGRTGPGRAGHDPAGQPGPGATGRGRRGGCPAGRVAPARGPLGAAAAAVAGARAPAPLTLPCPPASSALIGCRPARRTASWGSTCAPHWLRPSEHLPPASGSAPGRCRYAGRHWLAIFRACLVIGWRPRRSSGGPCTIEMTVEAGCARWRWAGPGRPLRRSRPERLFGKIVTNFQPFPRGVTKCRLRPRLNVAGAEV